jgi:hypothetical protein
MSKKQKDRKRSLGNWTRGARTEAIVQASAQHDWVIHDSGGNNDMLWRRVDNNNVSFDWSSGFDSDSDILIREDDGKVFLLRSKSKFEARVSTTEFGESPKEATPREASTPGLLIDLFVPAARAEDMLLEMGKAFEKRWLPKYGERRARQIYLLQSTGAVMGYWINWIKQHLDVFRFFAS